MSDYVKWKLLIFLKHKFYRELDVLWTQQEHERSALLTESKEMITESLLKSNGKGRLDFILLDLVKTENSQNLENLRIKHKEELQALTSKFNNRFLPARPEKRCDDPDL